MRNEQAAGSAAFLDRRIWSFNIEVARFAHPTWLVEFRKSWPACWVRDVHHQSLYLISTHRLALTRAEVMHSPFERVALLSVRDVHQLIRCWIARQCAGYLRENVAGRIARGNARVLGTAVIDGALVMPSPAVGEGSGKRADGSVRISGPADLATLHRRVLRTIYEQLTPEVAQRFRLRFRAGCFDGVQAIDDPGSLESSLVSIEMRDYLSKEGACILSAN